MTRVSVRKVSSLRDEQNFTIPLKWASDLVISFYSKIYRMRTSIMLIGLIAFVQVGISNT